jgi:hypothetical protein
MIGISFQCKISLIMNQKISFQKDKFKPMREYVWCGEICIGYLDSSIQEKKDINWQKYRSDKTLSLKTKERFIVDHTAYAYPNTFCGSFSNKEYAAKYILEMHKQKFKSLKKEE